MIKLNGVEIVPTIFPDGTSQVWKLPQQSLSGIAFNIVWDFEKESELFHIIQLHDLLKTVNKLCDINLHIPYLPYARQDKEISNNNTFARDTFIKIISRTCSFSRVTCLDAHSNLPILIESIFPENEIDFAFDQVKPTLICFPDTGAKDRYRKFFGKFPMCSFSKDRDQSTGRIKNMFLNELVDIKGESVLIIDDICDGGMTFKLCAEKLLTLGAKDVNLYTTHGIYSKGIETLKESGIKRIFNRKGEVK